MGRGVLLILALLLALPAAAASSSPESGVAGCRTAWESRGRPVRPGELALRLDFAMEPGPDELRWQWVLSLRNRTNAQIGLRFLTSNYGFVSIRQEGRLIHSTLEGSLPAVTYRTLAPRETYVCALRPSTLDLPPGRYELLAKVETYPRATIARRTLKISGG